jgi:hypothetical protein
VQGPKRNIARQNKTDLGHRGQTKTSLKTGYNVNVSDDQQPEIGPDLVTTKVLASLLQEN